MPTSVFGASRLSAARMMQFLRQINPTAPDLAAAYLQIGSEYGIRGDIAFAQSILETDYYRFTGDVHPEQNNFAGIGATGSGTRGAAFSTPQAGIEAHLQHLYAYAATASLPPAKLLLDPRFHLVNRGSAPNWEDLSGKWAADLNYGTKILQIYQEMSGFPQDVHFPDLSASHWAYPSIERAVQLGLLQGYENGEFRPNQPVSRAELAVALVRLVNTVDHAN